MNLDTDALLAELVEAATDARDYLSCIPETAAGGDDYAGELTRRLDRILSIIEGATP